MAPEDGPRGWQQKGLALIGWGVLAASAAGVGLFTFFSAMGTPLHPDPSAVPSDGVDRNPPCTAPRCRRPLTTRVSRELVLGSSTSFMTFPDRGMVVAMMSNTSDASLWPIALNVAEAFTRTLLDSGPSSSR